MADLVEDMASDYVIRHARYYQHGFSDTGLHYAVRLGSTTFASDDTWELVEKVAKAMREGY